VLQCVAVGCSRLQCVAVYYSLHAATERDKGASLLQCDAVCCSVLQCVAVCCSVIQCVAACCSVLQCDAVCCSALQCVVVSHSVLQCNAVYCSMHAACVHTVYYSVLQCVAVNCSVLQCVAVHCSVSQCVAVYCSVLQCVAVYCSMHAAKRASVVALHQKMQNYTVNLDCFWPNIKNENKNEHAVRKSRRTDKL